MAERNIVIVSNRCSRSKQGFGIRFERRNDKLWAATWAFGLKESAAKKEGYDKTRVKGSFVIEPEYPGCPHRRAKSFFLCGKCGHVACYDDESARVVCPWCARSGEIGGAIESLEAGTDR